MSRYDKYDGKSGGFRARLAADFAYTASNPDYAHVDLDKTFAVSLNSTGQVVKFGSGNTNFVGVMILTKPKAAGDVVDVMTDGEIVELLDVEILSTDVLAGGVSLFADVSVADGKLAMTSAAGDYYVGKTVEISTTGKARLVVRCGNRAV
jgi:hypothetical protein